MRRSTVIAATIVVALAVVGIGIGVTSAGAGTAVREETLTVAGTPEPDGAPVALDASIFLPDVAGPVPAVLLAHGFGGSKDDLSADARQLAAQGYVVLTYTARGFGRSGGAIHLDSPNYEIADARRLVDLLARRPEVRQDAPGDPRVGVAGGSYGGALALLLAGEDPRVDAIAPQITWNDLRQALFPQFALASGSASAPAAFSPVAEPGVFKRLWAGVFFGPGGSGSGSRASGSGQCGRFAAELCTAYQQAAQTGRPTSAILDLLWASSPARVLAHITAPTLLVQGEADSLFPLSEGDANAAGIAAHGTPVKVVWEGGGHDGGLDESARLRDLTTSWFDRYLKGDGRGGGGSGAAVDTRFEVTVPGALLSSVDSNPVPQVRVAPGLPGVNAQAAAIRATALPLSGSEQSALAPAGGNPAALTSLPGLGSALSLGSAALGAAAGAGAGTGSGTGSGAGESSSLSSLPGQVAVFQTAPLASALQVVGSPRVRVHIASSASDATVFASLYDVGPGGAATLPEQLVSPVYLADLPPAGSDVTIALPAVVHDVAVGHWLRLVVSTTDQGYAMPADPRQYRISLAGEHEVVVPTVATTPLAAGGLAALRPWALGLLAAIVLAVLAGWYSSRRTGASSAQPQLESVPLAITGLGKAYGDGFRAVSELSLRVETGWVLGLLGPNGAGKTTTMRMLMGLIRPSEGEIRVFGHLVTPGAPVLSRVGSFVEGPGFLPHVSGLDNLKLFWQATGRPLEEAHLEEALEVAGLGDDLHRRVRTYSHGMRQRLAIAQAMLGLPDLLVLDEPTNGLDPPQIREMREVLARYAATGRTVVVSSHLLAEVEQTCTHAVVMHLGRLVFTGPVAELVGSATALIVDVDDPHAAAAVASRVDGAHDVEVTETGIVLKLAGTARGELVRALVEAGLSVERLAPQRGLEEAFLTLVGEGVPRTVHSLTMVGEG